MFISAIRFKKETTLLNNTTKIKHLNVLGRIYKVTRVSFFYMLIEATETNLSVFDVPESELWDVEQFKTYTVRLINNGGAAEIVDFKAYKSKKCG